MTLNADWNLISRTIVPLISQPSPIFDSSTNGIGDITQSLFLSPAHPGALIWGVGPVFTMPSASDPILGTGKVLLGPTAVLLVTPRPWVIGVLVNNQWSVGGDPNRPSVNAFLAQPFVNYNMAGGWFLNDLAHHHRQLECTLRPEMDSPDRRRRSAACSRSMIRRTMRRSRRITTSSARIMRQIGTCGFRSPCCSRNSGSAAVDKGPSRIVNGPVHCCRRVLREGSRHHRGM